MRWLRAKTNMSRRRRWPEPSQAILDAREEYYAYLDKLYEKYPKPLPYSGLTNLLPKLTEQEREHLADLMRKTDLRWEGFVDQAR